MESKVDRRKEQVKFFVRLQEDMRVFCLSYKCRHERVAKDQGAAHPGSHEEMRRDEQPPQGVLRVV